MHALDDLNKKVDVLLKKYTALEAENQRLRDTIARHGRVEEELRKKIESLEQSMVSVHLGKTEISEDEKQNMRTQLDNVITEIDKILNTLND
jgi:predicted RNase H-like nuclease (RuvC/YqgF family)